MMKSPSLGWRNLTRPKPSPRRMISRLKLGVSGPQGGSDSGVWAAAEELRDSKTKIASSTGAVTPTSNSRFCISISFRALACNSISAALEEEYRVAHVSSYLRHDLECQWREPQSHSGTPASCQSQGHNGHLRPR